MYQIKKPVCTIDGIIIDKKIHPILQSTPSLIPNDILSMEPDTYVFKKPIPRISLSYPEAVVSGSDIYLRDTVTPNTSGNTIYKYDTVTQEVTTVVIENVPAGTWKQARLADCYSNIISLGEGTYGVFEYGAIYKSYDLGNGDWSYSDSIYPGVEMFHLVRVGDYVYGLVLYDTNNSRYTNKILVYNISGHSFSMIDAPIFDKTSNRKVSMMPPYIVGGNILYIFGEKGVIELDTSSNTISHIINANVNNFIGHTQGYGSNVSQKFYPLSVSVGGNIYIFGANLYSQVIKYSKSKHRILYDAGDIVCSPKIKYDRASPQLDGENYKYFNTKYLVNSYYGSSTDSPGSAVNDTVLNFKSYLDKVIDPADVTPDKDASGYPVWKTYWSDPTEIFFPKIDTYAVPNYLPSGNVQSLKKLTIAEYSEFFPASTQILTYPYYPAVDIVNDKIIRKKGVIKYTTDNTNPDRHAAAFSDEIRSQIRLPAILKLKYFSNIEEYDIEIEKYTDICVIAAYNELDASKINSFPEIDTTSGVKPNGTKVNITTDETYTKITESNTEAISYSRLWNYKWRYELQECFAPIYINGNKISETGTATYTYDDVKFPNAIIVATVNPNKKKSILLAKYKKFSKPSSDRVPGTIVLPAGSTGITMSLTTNETIYVLDTNNHTRVSKGLSVYYTTDGTTPNRNSNIVNGNITVSAPCILKAIVDVSPESGFEPYEGYSTSDVVTFNIRVKKKLPPPSVTPNGGYYPSTSLTAPNIYIRYDVDSEYKSNATIKWKSNDGPESSFSGLTYTYLPYWYLDLKIEVRAVSNNTQLYEDSDIVTAYFKKKLTFGKPVLTPDYPTTSKKISEDEYHQLVIGNYFKIDSALYTAITQKGTIRYTLDRSTPSVNSEILSSRYIFLLAPSILKIKIFPKDETYEESPEYTFVLKRKLNIPILPKTGIYNTNNDLVVMNKIVYPVVSAVSDSDKQNDIYTHMPQYLKDIMGENKYVDIYIEISSDGINFTRVIGDNIDIEIPSVLYARSVFNTNIFDDYYLNSEITDVHSYIKDPNVVYTISDTHIELASDTQIITKTGAKGPTIYYDIDRTPVKNNMLTETAKKYTEPIELRPKRYVEHFVCAVFFEDLE